MGVRAGQQEQGRICTVEVVDLQGATEGQVESQQCLRQPMKGARHIREGDQGDADVPGHPGAVMQRAADGHIAVQGHGSKEVKLSDHQHNEEETLSEAPSIGNGLVL